MNPRPVSVQTLGKIYRVVIHVEHNGVWGDP